MKKKTRAPFLTMVSVLACLSLLFGGFRMVMMRQSGNGEEIIKAYLNAHRDRPFLADLLGDDFPFSTLEAILEGADPFVAEQLADAGDLAGSEFDPGDFGDGSGEGAGTPSGEDLNVVSGDTPEGTDASGDENTPAHEDDPDLTGDPATGMGADDVTDQGGTGANGAGDQPAGDGSGDGSVDDGGDASEDSDKPTEPAVFSLHGIYCL